MLTTTLKTGSLSVSAIKYKFDANNYLTIRIETDTPHNIVGSAKILLGNVQDINIYDSNAEIQYGYFNQTFNFVAVSENALEYKEKINSGLAQAVEFVDLEDNGDPFVAEVENLNFTLEQGRYLFTLINKDGNDLDGALIKIQEENVYSDIDASYDSYPDFYTLEDTVENESLDSKELFFRYKARVSIENPTANSIVSLTVTRL